MPFQSWVRRRRAAVALVVASLLLPVAASADTPPQRLINVVEVTWPGARAATASVDELVSVIKNDTIERWRRISNGAVEFTFDRVLPTVVSDGPMPCDGSGASKFMTDVTLNAYRQGEIPSWDNRFLVILSRDPGGCGWDGRGVVNAPPSTSGMLLLNDTAHPTVVAHELGHNLGLGHSNLEKCTDGRADGPWADCSAIEYGSATDLMSNNDRSSTLAAYHQWRLGLLPDTAVAVADRTRSVTLQPVDTTTGTRALFIRDRSAAYWVEYRRADPANQIREGLVVYRTDPPPTSSVVDPVDNGTAALLDTSPTLGVWMINLGDYRWGLNSSGSPSLGAGLTFTTAFGGVSVTAAHTAAGAVVSVIRQTTPTPAAPAWTPRANWTGMSSQLTRPDLDDGGMAIDHFEARITTETGTTVSRVAATAVPSGARTYLAPVSAPVVVVASSLPEGIYDIELRAVNLAGVAGPWSARIPIAIDLGAPTVGAAFSVRSVTPGVAAVVQWTGARDAGAGLCSARAFNADGFALLQWSSDEAGSARFSVPASGSAAYTGVVKDCFGNAVRGDLGLSSTWRAASNFARTGSWRSGAAPRCTAANCTATIRTAAGSTAIVVAAGAGSVWVDGKRHSTIARSARTAPRVVARIEGAHRVQLRTSDLTLLGAQAVRAAWSALPAADTSTVGFDLSLNDDTQFQLSKIGFAQADFADGIGVAALLGGTGTEQSTLDFCNGPYPSEAERRDRRQVLVTRKAGDPYLFLSSETVRYAWAGTAKQAVAEIDAAAALCRSRGYSGTTAGVREAYTFHELPTLPKGLRPAAERRIFLVTVGEGSAARTLFIVYQFRGRTLNALYVAKQGADAIDTATVTRWLDVAVVLAGRLTTDQ